MIDITSVRINLIYAKTNLRAYATIELNGGFVIKDIKVIEAYNRDSGQSRLIVTMPDKELHNPCPHCKFWNRTRADFCNKCGKELPIEYKSNWGPCDGCDGTGEALEGDAYFECPKCKGSGEMKIRLYEDICFPINEITRNHVNKIVLDAYSYECKKAAELSFTPQPGKKPWIGRETRFDKEGEKV